MKEKIIDHQKLYRFPWTLPDNGISWLEPTARCNLTCFGCYRKNVKNSHKPFEEVKHELDVFQRLRKTDCISIAGGDPLLYPQIIELISEIKSRGMKPIINTNGVALTRELLHELKKAGVFGFTFHIDSKQGRGRGSEWEGKNELELNELRLYYAKMLAEEKNIACSFNSTVYGDTLKYVPGMVKWAQDNIDIVHTMVFILFRYLTPEIPFDFYAGDKKIVNEEVYYSSNEKNIVVNITAPQVISEIRRVYPDFSPAAYLNGTQKADDFKWLLTEKLGTKDRIFTYLDNKMIELATIYYHYKKDKYLSYASPKILGMGRTTILSLWMLNKSVRNALKNYLKYIAVNPLRIFKKVYMQSVMIIQPIDVMANGEQSMCDGCPDITVWKDNNGVDQLVWSCRLEEVEEHGVFLRTVPRKTREVNNQTQEVLDNVHEINIK